MANIIEEKKINLDGREFTIPILDGISCLDLATRSFNLLSSIGSQGIDVNNKESLMQNINTVYIDPKQLKDLITDLLQNVQVNNKKVNLMLDFSGNPSLMIEVALEVAIHNNFLDLIKELPTRMTQKFQMK